MRKLCAGILIFCMLVTQMVGVSEALASENIVYGDLTGDGRADIFDFAVMKMYLLGKISVFPSENGKKAADLNEDGKINAFDFAIFKQYLLNKITTLPYNPQSFVYKDIEPAKANELTKGNNIQIIDVRTAGEFETGFIEGAVNLDWHMNSTLFKQKLGSLDKKKAVLVYCASGKRSTESLEIFKSLNFKTVYNMKGGIAAWVEAGFGLKKPDPTKPEDPETPINPAELPAVVVGKTTICGEVINSRTEELLSGVNVFLRNKPEVKTTTDANGRYALEVEGSGDYVVDIEIEGYTSAQRTIKIEKPGYDYPVNKAYLVKLDTKVTEFSSEGGVHTSSEGKIMMEFPAGAIPEGTTIKASATRFEKGEELPNALPELSHFTHAMELYPDGVNFLKPVTVKIKNVRGFKPGAKVPMGYYNKETSQWQDEGQAVVDSTGQWIVGEVKHFSPWDWNHPVKGSNGPPSGSAGCGGNGSDGPCSGASSGGNSTVDMGRGSLKNEISIPGVRNMYGERDLQFNYNSRFANPVYLLDFKAGLGSQKRPLKTRFSYTVGSLKKEIFLEPMNGDMRYRYLFDCTDAYGNKLPTGYYTTSMEVANGYQSEFYEAPFFGAPADAIRPTGVLTDPENPYWYGLKSKGSFAVVNSINSPFGAGWNLDELSRIYLTDAGNTIIMVEGNSVVIYKKNDASVFTTANPQDGKIIWADDERYHLILPKGESFLYDRQGYIVTKKDTNGNKTTYSWDDSNKDGEKELAVITDPGDLKYTFEYINGKLKSMTDPAGAKNYFALDEKSNLLSAKLSDEEQWSFQYDGKHLMTGKTDANGGDTSYVYDVNGFVTDVYSPEREITEVGADGTEKTEKKREYRIYTASDSVGVIDTSAGKGTFKNPAKAVNANIVNYSYKVENSEVENGVVDNNSKLLSSDNKLFNIYDEAGRLTAQSDYSDDVNEYTYDANGNVVCVANTKNNYSSIATGGTHTVALKKDGTVVCWGDNRYDKCNVPAGLTDVVSVAAGPYHNAALKKDGTVVCWGSDNYGQCKVPAELTGVAAVSAGSEFTVALKKDGTVVCWGNNDAGQCNVPAGLTNVASIAAGLHHTVALKRDGTVVCWGYNRNGQCNVPAGLTGVAAVSARWTCCAALKKDGTIVYWGDTSYQQNVPDGLTDIAAIAIGDHHTVALKKDGTVVCWGYNYNGQCNVPAGLKDVAAISAGGGNSIALKKDGKIVCWGNNYNGQCNVPSSIGIDDVSIGGNSAAVLKKDGSVMCWGFKEYSDCNVPPDGLNNVAAVSAGLYHTAALKKDGTVVCWGKNDSGQCNIPGGLTDVTAVSAGGYHTVALKKDGTLVCWGSNSNRQCNIPDGLTDIAAVCAGGSHTVALKKNGTVVCWGRNDSGQCNVPAGLTDVTAISAGNSYTVALKKDGTVVCWGDNYYGQCKVPAGLTDVTAISAGNFHVVALTKDGTVVCWGDNYYGQCKSQSFLTGIKTISAGWKFSAVLKEDGSLVCWGDNSRSEYNTIQEEIDVNLRLGLNLSTKYEYTSNNNISKIIENADGEVQRVTQYFYDNAGNLTAAIAPDGLKTTYGYDSRGLKTYEELPNGTTITYQYDEKGWLTTKTVKADGKEAATTYTYDKRGNIATETLPGKRSWSYTYDNGNRKTSMTDPMGRAWKYEYDKMGNLTKEINPLSEEWQYKYDPKGMLTQVIDPTDTIKEKRYYNELRYLTKVEYADGSSEKYYVDNEGKTLKKFDTLGNAISFTYNEVDDLRSITDPQNGVITLSYDAISLGNAACCGEASGASRKVTQIKTPLGNTVEYQYNPFGEMTISADKNSNLTETNYDNGGNIVAVKYPDGTQKKMEYNLLGMVSKVTERDGTACQYDYDGLGRLVTFTDAAGKTETTTYDEAGNIIATKDKAGSETSYSYDEAGNLKQTTDALGCKTLYDYDDLNRLVKKTLSDGTTEDYIYDSRGLNTGLTITGKEGIKQETKCEYDARGRRITIVNANGFKKGFEYNSEGRLTKEKYPDGSSNIYSYDSLGRLTKTTTPSGDEITYEYDADGRLLSKTADGSKTTYSYDKNGNILEASNDISKVTRTYDSLNRITKEIQSITGTDAYTSSYAYSSTTGRLDSETLGKTKLDMGYDNYGRLSTITSSAAGIFQYNYDAAGRSEKLKNPNNVTLTNTYDELERPTGKSYSNDVFKALYNYNSVGKLTAENKAFENTATSDLYNYDSLGRLTGVKYNAPTVSGQTYDNSANFTKSQNYAYDLLNNRTSVESDGTKALYNQVDGKYSADSLNRINTVDSQTILYDNNHNIINDGRLTYNWSSENSLKKVEENSKEVASYSYDAFGRRIKKALANGDTTFYFYDGWQEAEDRDSNGNATVYTHGTSIDDLLAVTKQGKTVYTHSNFQGSVVAVTDAEGKVLERIGYDVYGKPEFYAADGKLAANKVKSDYTEFLFTGRRLDTETGNYYYRARYYTPALGRFLSEDSLREDLNLYAYCNNDPVNFVDPSGNRLIVPMDPVAQRQIMSQLSKLTNYDLKVDPYGNVSIDGYHPGKKKDKGDDLISRLIHSDKRIKINIVCGGSITKYNEQNATNGKGTNSRIGYDPSNPGKAPTVDPRSGRSYVEKLPSEIEIGHELIHADRAARGIMDPRNSKEKHTYMDPSGKSIYENSRTEEQKTVGLNGNSSHITENDLRNEGGYKRRGAYYY